MLASHIYKLVGLCVLTGDVEYSVHEDQNSRDDNLCKSDAQVSIYLKLTLIKLNPAVL